MSLNSIIAELNERKQRATYGAVAGIVGGLPRGLMAGRERNHMNSWVVGAATGPRRVCPTGCTNIQIHPDCLQQIRECSDSIIEDTATLRRWLNS